MVLHQIPTSHPHHEEMLHEVLVHYLFQPTTVPPLPPPLNMEKQCAIHGNLIPSLGACSRSKRQHQSTPQAARFFCNTQSQHSIQDRPIFSCCSRFGNRSFRHLKNPVDRPILQIEACTTQSFRRRYSCLKECQIRFRSWSLFKVSSCIMLMDAVKTFRHCHDTTIVHRLVGPHHCRGSSTRDSLCSTEALNSFQLPAPQPLRSNVYLFSCESLLIDPES